MLEEAVKVLKPLDKYVLKQPPEAIEMTSVGDTIYASFDNVHIPLDRPRLAEMRDYCAREIGVLNQYGKKK